MNGQFMQEEAVLERLFNHAQIQPGELFYERMSQAPWVTRSSHISARRVSLAIAAISMLITLFLLASPFRSLAQQALEFFFRGEADTVSSPVFVEPTEIAPALQDLDNLQRASEVAGFPVRLPAHLPGGIQPTAVSVHPGSILITYSDEHRTTIVLSQQNNASAAIYVGATAQVEAVLVDGVAGEFVRGGWAQTESELIWNNSLDSSHLFWEKDGVRYSLTAVSGELSLETLLMIANSLP